MNEDSAHTFMASRADSLHDPVSTEDLVDQRIVAEYLQIAVGRLPPKEARVLRMRFGFEGRVFTLKEVARKLDLTPERIRQIESTALSHLRSPRLRRALSGM